MYQSRTNGSVGYTTACKEPFIKSTPVHSNHRLDDHHKSAHVETVICKYASGRERLGPGKQHFITVFRDGGVEAAARGMNSWPGHSIAAQEYNIRLPCALCTDSSSTDLASSHRRNRRPRCCITLHSQAKYKQCNKRTISPPPPHTNNTTMSCRIRQNRQQFTKTR